MLNGIHVATLLVGFFPCFQTLLVKHGGRRFARARLAGLMRTGSLPANTISSLLAARDVGLYSQANRAWGVSAF